jgi:YesN/AraC family two-component response regulator
MKRLDVLLAGDNRIVRREFRRKPDLQDDLEVVGEAKNGRQAVAMVKNFIPHWF